MNFDDNVPHISYKEVKSAVKKFDSLVEIRHEKPPSQRVMAPGRRSPSGPGNDPQQPISHQLRGTEIDLGPLARHWSGQRLMVDGQWYYMVTGDGWYDGSIWLIDWFNHSWYGL